MLKLRHDGIKSHTTHQRRKSRGGRDGRGWRIRRLCSWLLRSKLGLTPPNRSCVDGTHDSIVGRMAKDPRDSQGKNELVTSLRIPIDIYDGDNEMTGEVYGKIL